MEEKEKEEKKTVEEFRACSSLACSCSPSPSRAPCARSTFPFRQSATCPVGPRGAEEPGRRRGVGRGGEGREGRDISLSLPLSLSPEGERERVWRGQRPEEQKGGIRSTRFHAAASLRAGADYIRGTCLHQARSPRRCVPTGWLETSTRAPSRPRAAGERRWGCLWSSSSPFFLSVEGRNSQLYRKIQTSPVPGRGTRRGPPLCDVRRGGQRWSRGRRARARRGGR